MNKAAIKTAREIIAYGEKTQDASWFIDYGVENLKEWARALDEVERLWAIIEPLIGPSDPGAEPAPAFVRRPSEPSTGRVPALWFDSQGCGPDHFYFEVFPFKELRDGDKLVAPPSLGLRLRAGDLVILGRGMIDGGFNLGREQVAALHQQFGAWLASNPDKG